MSKDQANWTPEPWRTTAYEGGWPGIGSQRDGLLFKAVYNNDANPPRAVECVNFLCGVSAEELLDLTRNGITARLLIDFYKGDGHGRETSKAMR